MNILALNCGSSSVKYQLYNWETHCVTAKGVAERIGVGESFLLHKTINGEKKITEPTLADHLSAVELIMKTLTDPVYGVIKEITEISAVGHRVVHGGEKYTKSEIITPKVTDTIKELSVLAPLHNPPNLAGILAVQKLMPDAPQVAVFDTAFHQTMPDTAYLYAVPMEWYEKNNIRKYGFHGASHLYVSKRAAVMLGKSASECNLITLHIGNGVSVTAVRNGVSADTSMGFTPLEGAVMGTRCGDIDPAVPLYMQKILGKSAGEIDSVLNKNSGLLGITKRFTDFRDIERQAKAGDKLCELAINIKVYRLKKYIGMYTATLGRLDAVIFTAGTGENSALLRKLTLKGLEHIGIDINEEKNLATNTSSGETDISTPESKVKVFVIPTNEELVLVEDVVAVLNGAYTDHMRFPYSFVK
ncbi:MAG: acetate kinase [Deferribacteraceae bacterium]|jgi:acetate kinase|nr:acetate kinase [Deferribacteraceae bacterium]